MIDIKSLLENLDIDFKDSGENVTHGWINIQCPFCYDPKNHLGINLESTKYHCWVCGAKGNLEYLLHTITSKPYFEIKQLIKEFEIDFQEEEKPKIINVNSDLLKPYDLVLPEIHRNYLIKRKFDPDFIQAKYHIRSQYKYGYFAYRIVIPVIEEGQVINLTGRDVTDKQEERYKHLPNEKAIIPMKDCLYNIDSVKNKAVIVEGPTDVWRVGDGSIATMGTEFTSAQIKLLKDKQIKNIFILYDKEAEKNAEKLGNICSSFSHVEILYLDKGDPAEMTDREVKNLRKEIGI